MQINPCLIEKMTYTKIARYNRKNDKLVQKSCIRVESTRLSVPKKKKTLGYAIFLVLAAQANLFQKKR